MGNTESQKALNELQSRTGYYFKNQEVLKQVLTHESLRVNDPAIPTYQRLEFLGDSVLQFIITNYLFSKFPTHTEGQLTEERKKLVSNQKLKGIATSLEFENFVKVADSVSRQLPGSRFDSYCDIVEALIGGIYLDAGSGVKGLEAATAFIFKMWGLTEPNQANCIIS